MPKVRFDSSFNSKLNGAAEMEIPALSLLQLITELGTRFPGIEKLILDSQLRINSFILIYVDKQEVRNADGLNTKLSPDSIVSFKKVLSGG